MSTLYTRAQLNFRCQLERQIANMCFRYPIIPSVSVDDWSIHEEAVGRGRSRAAVGVRHRLNGFSSVDSLDRAGRSNRYRLNGASWWRVAIKVSLRSLAKRNDRGEAGGRGEGQETRGSPGSYPAPFIRSFDAPHSRGASSSQLFELCNTLESIEFPADFCSCARAVAHLSTFVASSLHRLASRARARPAISSSIRFKRLRSPARGCSSGVIEC